MTNPETNSGLLWPILRGVGKITGDGWKDTTKIGEVVFVYNTELPPPHAPGQFPRVGNPIWSASTDQYDFQPATVDELRGYLDHALLAAEAQLARQGEVQDRWRDMVQAHAAAMRMIIEGIEQLFGPIASVESDDASLLRGPEPHHRAEGVIEALQRIKSTMSELAGAEAKLALVLDAMKKIEGGHIEGASDLVIAGNWQELFNRVQLVARSTLSPEDSHG